MMGNIILVLVLWPGTWQSGHEVHIPFNTMEECKAAVETHKPNGDERRQMIYCTTKENEQWVWPNQNPANKPLKQ